MPSPGSGTTRRRGRPKSGEGPAVSASQVVDEAVRALARNGYAGLSLRSLARTLGVSLATVQRHFATKDDLWRAAVDSLVEPAAENGPGGQTPEAELSSQFQGAILRASRRPGLTAAIWNDSGPGASERLDYLKAKATPTLLDGRQRLAEAIAAGMARPVNVVALQALIGLGITSLASSPEALRRLFDVDLDDPHQVAELADGLADIVVNGVVRNQPGDPTG